MEHDLNILMIFGIKEKSQGHKSILTNHRKMINIHLFLYMMWVITVN